jgi:hypothetical protein
MPLIMNSCMPFQRTLTRENTAENRSYNRKWKLPTPSSKTLSSKIDLGLKYKKLLQVRSIATEVPTTGSLVDSLQTSDEYLMQLRKTANASHLLKYRSKKSLSKRLGLRLRLF